MTTGRPGRWAVFVAGAVLLAATGCGGVNRRFVIESNVPNAQVYINNHPVGAAPAHATFEYYGYYNIELVHPDYQRLLDATYGMVKGIMTRTLPWARFHLNAQYSAGPTASVSDRADSRARTRLGDERVVREVRRQVRTHSDWSDTGPAAAMRDAEGLVQVQM